MMKTTTERIGKLIAMLLMMIMVLALTSIPARTVGSGSVTVQDVQKIWRYSDGTVIPSKELNALIEQGHIPASVDIFYALTSSDDSQFGYESADGKQLSCLLDIVSDPEMKPLNEVGPGDIGGWSKQTLSQKNNWSLSFDDDDLDTVFGV